MIPVGSPGAFMNECPGGGESSGDDLPPLFESDDDVAPTPVPSPAHLHCCSAWSVVESPTRVDGTRERWLVQKNNTSLDQTRVRMVQHEREWRFVRDRLSSLHSQVGVLGLALSLTTPDQPPRAPVVVILGGGGMAMPMCVVHAHETAEVVVVEQDPIAIDLARRFFGAVHARLRIVEGDAFDFVLSGRSTDVAVLIIDIDFMNGEPPSVFVSAIFWDRLFAAVREAGVVVVNTIGASPERVDSLAKLALSSQTHHDGLVAGCFEPAHDSERGDRWTSFVPRPSTLVFGREVLLELFRRAGSVDWTLKLDTGLEQLLRLASPLLEGLASNRGLAGRWRKIP